MSVNAQCSGWLSTQSMTQSTSDPSEFADIEVQDGRLKIKRPLLGKGKVATTRYDADGLNTTIFIQIDAHALIDTLLLH